MKDSPGQFNFLHASFPPFPVDIILETLGGMRNVNCRAPDRITFARGVHDPSLPAFCTRAV
jgi:hypothetical protein